MLESVKNIGFLNHINRLYLASFMLQMFISPNEIYNWFYSFFIDAD